MEYREILSKIDEKLAEKCRNLALFNSTITRFLSEYLSEHPEKKDEVREIFYNGSFDENSCDWSRLYLSVFYDKESCLKLLNDERYIFYEDVLKCNQEPEVVAKVLEKDPTLVINFLQKCPEKKEEYKTKALDFFYKFQKGEIDASYHYKIISFFRIYEEDKKLLLDILESQPVSYDLYNGILNVRKDEEFINKMLDKLKNVPEAETRDICDSIIRGVKEEDVYERILSITNDSRLVNLMTFYCSGFSDEFKEHLLHHQNLSSQGWRNLSKFMPDSAFSDEIIERMLARISSESYGRETEVNINGVLLHILNLRPNAEYARKVFECCLKISDYGKNYFCEEKKVLLKVLNNDSSNEMFQRVLDYVITSKHPEMFEELISLRPTVDTLSKIEMYYQEYYKEKAKAKAEMKQVYPGMNEIVPDACEYNEISKPRRRRKICKATDEFSELKEKLKKGESVEFQILNEQEQFDYVGYYETMKNIWHATIENTDDLRVLDQILVDSIKTRKKAMAYASQTKGTYNREKAKEDVIEVKAGIDSFFHDKGYITKKLKKMYPKLSVERAVSKLFKHMLTTNDKKEKAKLNAILMAEGLDFYAEFIRCSQGKIDAHVLDYVLKEKEQMIDKLPQFDEYQRQDIYDKIKTIESNLEEKHVIETILKEKYPDLEFEAALIKEAARVVKSGDKKEMERFNNILLAEGEQRLLNDIDEKVCNYLVNNFTKQNFDDVNALRSFYGLKIIIDETPFEIPNLRTVRRMQFEDVVRPAEPWSEYYEVQFSDAYRNFVPDKRRRFKESDYYDVMDRSEAFQILFEYGYSDFAYLLPNALAKLHVPPEVAAQFNIKDLQAVFYAALPDAEKDVYGWDGDFLFTKNRIELKGEYDTSDLEGARQTYWMDVVNNKQLVRIMNDDLLRHGISDDDVSQLFQMAEDCGYPNAGRKSEKVSDVIFSLHHVLALKDGGLNYPSNYAPTCIYELGHNSHAPLHRYDTPKDIFYVVEGAKLPTDVMLTMKPQHGDAKKVRIRTVFTDDEINPHKKVLFYGGARKSSRYVGRLHSMENIALKAQALGREQKKKENQMKALVQMVFLNAKLSIDKANERVQQRVNAKKRKKIEKKKQKVRVTVSQRKNSHDGNERSA